MTGGCAVPCRGGDSRARRCTGGTNGPPLKWRRPKACHCEAPKGPWRPERAARGSALGVQSRQGTSSSYKVPIKTYKPIASVAAFPAQPLAALPPYGCGVPLAVCERPAGWQYLRRKFIGAMPSSLSLRGGRRPTWQSRSTRPDHRKAIGENATAFPRLPRPLWGLAMTNPGTLRHGITTAIPATANGAQ